MDHPGPEHPEDPAREQVDDERRAGTGGDRTRTLRGSLATTEAVQRTGAMSGAGYLVPAGSTTVLGLPLSTRMLVIGTGLPPTFLK